MSVGTRTFLPEIFAVVREELGAEPKNVPCEPRGPLQPEAHLKERFELFASPA